LPSRKQFDTIIDFCGKIINQTEVIMLLLCGVKISVQGSINNQFHSAWRPAILTRGPDISDLRRFVGTVPATHLGHYHFRPALAFPAL
jgi:hypothetical protein